MTPHEVAAAAGALVALAFGVFVGWSFRQQDAYLRGMRDGIVCARRNECWLRDEEGGDDR